MIPAIVITIQQGGGLGICTGHYNAWNPHYIQLKTGCVESFNLLVHRNQNFTALMTAFLSSWSLVLNMIPGDTNFHKTSY